MLNRFFFGYGSLVNRATHGYLEAHPAKITGWRRSWCPTTHRDLAFLTSVPEPGSEIDGLIAGVPAADWNALDERESAYDRVSTSEVSHPIKRDLDLVIYTIPNHRQIAPGPGYAILLSYLDVVVQGYMREFGEDGVVRFFDTTEGWEAAILNDRANPIYKRAQELSRSEVALTDHHLARVQRI